MKRVWEEKEVEVEKGGVPCGVDDGGGRGVVAVLVHVEDVGVGVGAVLGAAFVGAQEVSVLCWLHGVNFCKIYK